MQAGAGLTLMTLNMANKKKKSSAASKSQRPMSDRRYFQERVSALPHGSCYMTPDIDGMRLAIITRRMANGKLAFSSFCVDTGCLGVKYATYRYNMSEEELKEYMDRLGVTFEEVTYATVHNFILGAVEYAENLGISPDPDYNTAQLIMEEDTDDIELIPFHFGDAEGRPVLMIGPDGNERKYIGLLDRRLGPRGYTVIDSSGDADVENMVDISEEMVRSRRYREISSFDEDDIRYFDAFAELLDMGAVTFDGVVDSEDEIDENEPDVIDMLFDISADRHDEVLSDTADRSFLTSDKYDDAERLQLWIQTRELGRDPLDKDMLAETICKIRQTIAEADDSTII